VPRKPNRDELAAASRSVKGGIGSAILSAAGGRGRRDALTAEELARQARHAVQIRWRRYREKMAKT
jgi:hypothetical protein